MGMWMMCLLSDSLVGCTGPGLSGGGPGPPAGLAGGGRGGAELSGERLRGSPLLDSDISDGEGVLGGVSMDGMGWSLKQADS